MILSGKIMRWKSVLIAKDIICMSFRFWQDVNRLPQPFLLPFSSSVSRVSEKEKTRVRDRGGKEGGDKGVEVKLREF